MAVDPETGQLVPLFNPRTDEWHDQFDWNGYELVGRSEIGRALIALFELNHARRLKIRQAEALFGLFPPLRD